MRTIKLIAAGLSMVLLPLIVFYSLGGIQERMPERAPVVLDPQEICTERWTCHDPSALAALWEATARGERPLRIASYNVHKCTGMDFRRDPGRVAEVIRSLDADIISLQEVLSDPGETASAQTRTLAKKTGMYMAVAGHTKHKKDGRYGNALLSRFPISSVRLHDISLGSFEPRGIIDADIVVGGLTIRVLVTHLGLWPVERNRQVDRLLEILPERPGSPLIVMGDTNDWLPGSPALQRLRARLGEPVTMRTFPALFPVLPLDRIWIPPSESLRETLAHQASLPSRLARIASDHLPVVATVYLKAIAQGTASR